jgi:predicted transcriptional regulator
MKQVSFRLEDNELKELDAVAGFENKDRTSLLREMVQERLELNRWQLEQIELGYSQSEKEEYAEDCEILRLLLD